MDNVRVMTFYHPYSVSAYHGGVPPGTMRPVHDNDDPGESGEILYPAYSI